MSEQNKYASRILDLQAQVALLRDVVEQCELSGIDEYMRRCALCGNGSLSLSRHQPDCELAKALKATQ